MGLRLLLDEDTERELATKLRHAEHDVERVVEATELGPGATDDSVREYSRNTGRIIATHDDDHISVAVDEHAGVFYAPNQCLSAFELFRIVQRISEVYPNQSEIPPVVFLTTDWLR